MTVGSQSDFVVIPTVCSLYQKQRCPETIFTLTKNAAPCFPSIVTFWAKDTKDNIDTTPQEESKYDRKTL